MALAAIGHSGEKEGSNYRKRSETEANALSARSPGGRHPPETHGRGPPEEAAKSAWPWWGSALFSLLAVTGRPSEACVFMGFTISKSAGVLTKEGSLLAGIPLCTNRREFMWSLPRSSNPGAENLSSSRFFQFFFFFFFFFFFLTRDWTQLTDHCSFLHDAQTRFATVPMQIRHQRHTSSPRTSSNTAVAHS